MRSAHNNFWLKHLILPLLGFISLVVIIEVTSFDLLLADFLYAVQGQKWQLKDNTIFSTILHDDARKTVILISICVLFAAIVASVVDKYKHRRKALWYLLLALLVPPLLVGIGKQITQVDCPWDITRYGGQYAYLSLFEHNSKILRYGKCFPAGHASGGYAFLSLYFFFLVTHPEWKKAGLWIGVITGLLFGIIQQMRGAHFLSHDLWTVAICWFSALFWYWLFWRAQCFSKSAQKII